jgi:hypothetical protein
VAKRVESASCCELRIFTAKQSEAINASKFVDDFPRQNITKGGDKDTDVKEFAVIPWGVLLSMVVIIVTPVVKVPITSRNFLVSSGISHL